MKPILLIIGTRPEGIKMAPVLFALKQAQLPTLLCSTSQHTNLLNEVYQTFGFAPDFELHVMQHNQDLFHVTQDVLYKTKKVFQDVKPSLVLVHGDTTTTMASSLSAFYLGIPVGHVEAGLRTHNISNPFPEEMNRRFVSVTARYHFAPTQQAVKNLQEEKIDPASIFYTGNTIVDALRIMREKIARNALTVNPDLQAAVEQAKKNGQYIMLVTAHRRESFHGGIERILTTIKTFALHNPDVFILYPYHPNPHILETIQKINFEELNNMFVSTPLAYKDLVYALEHADWVATDSGGIQEEAISLGKKVIVFREVTERPEGVIHGLATLVGTDCNKIMQACSTEKKLAGKNTQNTQHVFGDGYAADKIVGIIQKITSKKKKELNEPRMHYGPWVHRFTNRNSSSRT